MSDSPAGLKPLLGEVIGTFALVFAGCGAIVIDDALPGAVGHVGIALTFGLVVNFVLRVTGLEQCLNPRQRADARRG